MPSLTLECRGRVLALGHVRPRRSFVRAAPFCLLAVLGLLLAGCFGGKDFIQRFVPEADDALARKFIEAVRTGDTAGARQMLDPRLDNEQTTKNLAEIRRRFLDHGEPLAVEVIGFASQASFSGTEGKASLNYQLQFTDAWVLAQVEIERKSSVSRIIRGNFTPLTASLEALHAFSLRGKSPWHYLFLAACVGIPLFILGAVIACARARVRRKWLWIIFILLGVGRFELNWTNGAFDVSPVSIQLAGAGATRGSVYAPWILSWSIPLGAIVFLLRRRHLIASAAEPEPSGPPPLPQSL